MEIFELIVDEKVQAWRRLHVKVEANSKEEAVQKCLETEYDEVVDSEYLFETEEPLDYYPTDPATIEVMDIDYNILGTNERN